MIEIKRKYYLVTRPIRVPLTFSNRPYYTSSNEPFSYHSSSSFLMGQFLAVKLYHSWLLLTGFFNTQCLRWVIKYRKIEIDDNLCDIDILFLAEHFYISPERPSRLWRSHSYHLDSKVIRIIVECKTMGLQNG